MSLHQTIGRLFFNGDPTFERIAEAHGDLVSDFRRFDPLRTAASFAGLLTLPELQANCLRIEVLTHLALIYCDGRLAPTRALVLRNFERLGNGYCGSMEDPIEDVFVSLVNTPAGNFRVFEGSREANGFLLQRILNVLDQMPDGPTYDRIRASTNNLLKLSEAIAARAGAAENTLGTEMPHDALPKNIADRLPRVRDMVQFTENELVQLNISRETLTPFFLRATDALRGQVVGHTDLERTPLLFDGHLTRILLPTAVGSAITRFVIEWALSQGMSGAFSRALADDFADLFRETPILGKLAGVPINWQKISGGRIGASSVEVDPGRILNLIFFVDGPDGFAEHGLNGANYAPDALASAIGAHIGNASDHAKHQVGFQEGISLVVTCGFGRGFRVEVNNSPPEHWRLEFLSAYDLVTLSWLPDFDPLSLWRVLHSQETVEQAGVTLMNPNGLLNLVAWSRQLDGHLVPHGRLPDDFLMPGTPTILQIEQNALRNVRHAVMKHWSPRRVLDVDGRWLKARKLGESIFEEDLTVPLYGSEEDARKGKLRGVYVAPRRPWWIEIDVIKPASNQLVYEYWRMLCVWLGRAAPVLDRAYETLPVGPISFAVRFANSAPPTEFRPSPMSLGDLRSLIHPSYRGGSLIQIEVDEGFSDGLAQADNVAERALAEALIAGTAEAASRSQDSEEKAALVQQICPNSDARNIHVIASHDFRDAPESGGQIQFIDSLDDAALRIGLGWRVRSRDDGSDISGRRECTSYLNRVVRTVLDDLCSDLRLMDRNSFVTMALLNHEAALSNANQWRRTAKANIAMHDDKNAATKTIIDRQSRLNSASLASRILIEAAICECPENRGRIPGRLDLSRAMARVIQAYHFGGWSDAIHWGAMEPAIKIRPLGDVHADQSFIDTVYDQFGQGFAGMEVQRAVDSYSKQYSPPEVIPSVKGLLSTDFLESWEAEFGVSLDAYRHFIGELEGLGIDRRQVVFDLARSALIAMLSKAANVPLDSASSALEKFSLAPRPEWRTIVGNFTDKDWYPWRFRRRLSLLRRPFVKVDETSDPTFLVAPALIRDGFYLTGSLFHRGEIPSSQAVSFEMQRWIGRANNVERTAFNSEVAVRMEELGWIVKKEVTLTQIVGQPLDHDYGDVDVLAWRPESGRVLVMECKDLQFHKTLGEVAEQLSDFRGELQQNGKPDHLRRHLDRLNVLRIHRQQLARTLKLAEPFDIEGHLVFKNLVPMRFAWEQMATKVRLSLFSELEQL